MAASRATKSRWNTSSSGTIIWSGRAPGGISKKRAISACQRALTSVASIAARAASKDEGVSTYPNSSPSSFMYSE